jgi:hypothetical protein
MQSKWLTWQPGSVGFVGSSVGEDSIIHSRSDTENGTSCPLNPSIIENAPGNLPSKPTKPNSTDSAYSKLASQAMQRITGICPPGALKWAREAHPALTDKIDVELLAQLNQLWANQAPLSEFQVALDELVRLHREVGGLFEQRVQPCG